MQQLNRYLFTILTTGFLYLTQSPHAQVIPDSLINKLSHSINDSTRIRTLLDIGQMMEATATETSIAYYRQALLSSQKINNKHLELSAANNIGIALIESNKLDSALVFFEAAIRVAGALHDSLRMARITGNIGNVYIHRHDRAKAIAYYIKGISILEKCDDQIALPAFYSNISDLFSEQNEYTKSIEYGNKSFTLAEKTGDDYTAVNALLNLVITYSRLGQYEKQFSLLKQSLPLAKKNGDIEQIATVYHNLGAYYFQRQEYRASLDNYLLAHSYVKQLNNQYHLCTSYTDLALVYLRSGEDNTALKYILMAEKLANQVGARANLREIFQTRAEIEQKAGHYQNASRYLSKRIEISDSLFKSETSEKVAEVEAKYQDEKKQEEILHLEKDKKIQALSIKQKSTLNYVLTGSVVVLLILGFLVYRNFGHRQRLAKQQGELQQQLIRELEKDKHLVAVDSLLKGQEDERSRLAKDLHDGLGGLLSGVKFSLSNMKDNLILTPDNMAVFERSLDMIDTSIRELRRVAHNMMPEMLTQFGLDEALREYCHKINTAKILTVKYQSLGMAERVDKSIEIIIYRIVQELLNNTLKHAGATETFVQLIREGARLNIVVEDNGRGFAVDNVDNNKGAGLGNVRSRVEYLKGQLDIHSEPGKGTLVNIEFKI